MRLALGQILVIPGDPAGNLRRALQCTHEAATSGCDLLLLPEALDCGWTHPCARDFAGTVPGGTTFEKLRTAAQRCGIWICAGLVERVGEVLFNSAVLIDHSGQLRLLHRKLNELNFARSLYTTGDRLGVVESQWGRIGLMICADAFAENFPVSRTLGMMGAKLVLSPCAWAVPPERSLKVEPYGELWKSSYGPVAEAFRMTIAGCSNVGPITAGEWNGWRCIGNSLVVGPDGKILAEAAGGEDQDMMFIVEV